MRRLLAFGVVLAFASTASASFFDDFDSYADQAAFETVWIPTPPGQVLDQAKGWSDLQSVTNKPDPVGTNTRALGQEYPGTDAFPIEFSVMTDVDVLHWWTRSWVTLNAYDDEGGLQAIVALGFTSGQGQTKYHGRMYGGGDGWFDIDDLSGDPQLDRTTEWTKLIALIKTDTVEYYVDAQPLGDPKLGYISPRTPGITFDTVTIGTSYSSQEQVWFDDVFVIPEPSALALLVLGGLALIRRR